MGENLQVNNENSVHTRNNVKQPSPVIVNCLGYKLGDIDLLKTRRGRKSKKPPKSVITPFKGLVVIENDAILGSKNLEPSSPTSGHGNSVNEKSVDKLNCMDSGADSSFKPRDHDNLANHPAPVECKDTKVYSLEDNRISVGAHQNKYHAAALLTNNNCQVHCGNSNVIDDLALEREDEEVRFQQDCRASTESQKRIITANVTQPSTLQNGVVDKVIPYSSNMGLLPKENNCLPSENIENQMEYQSEPSKLLDLEKFILAGSDCSNQSPNNCRPVKNQRRYKDVNKDEDAVVGAVNSDFALNDVANCALDDGSNLASETVVTSDHRLQSRTLSNSESADLYIYSQPFHEPIWRTNEVSNGLVSEIIESDSALKVTVGIADLLIFPSTILPEQNHSREQDGLACATEEWKQQKQNLLDQQDGSACASEEGQLQEEHLLNQQDLEQHKSSDQETNVVNKPLVECSPEAEMEAMKITMTEGFTLPGCSLSHSQPNSPIKRSNCSMNPEQMNQQEGITSSTEFNAPSAAEPSAEGGHGQSGSGS
ncbi:hypothetical protein BAE44_0021901 [Dichanthelium oligosanthes]|uniref:AIPP2-like SPOC-like domain-containing protein n=1 Tax=Dichanthelium oligosanthes TaxID=888268 RepID=A0A1E5UW17_9POAL|nr:hypothetical protein BAE44_0021901 [Dichanthelium oligosanthes]